MALRKTLRRIKRFAYLGGAVGLVVGLKRMRDRGSARLTSGAPPTPWPPLQSVADVPVATAAPVADVPVATSMWVAPLEDGSCPLSHPIKANDNSQIFHEPGGRFYQRTRAERCYVDAASAQADGYRAAKGAGGATAPGGTS